MTAIEYLDRPPSGWFALDVGNVMKPIRMSDEEFLQRAREYVETQMADGFTYAEARALLFARFEQARQEEIKRRRRSFRVIGG